MSLSVVLLGTGNPLPHPLRAGPSTLVRVGGKQILIDCGRGVLMRLAAAGTWPIALDAVCLTHLHSDHICDFNDVLTTHWVMSSTSTPLRVIGPPGTRRFVDATLAMLSDDISWRLAHHADLNDAPVCDVVEIEDGELHDHALVHGTSIRVLVAPTDHRPVQPTVGYRFEHEGASVAVVGDTLPCAGVDHLCRDATFYVQSVIRDSAIKMIPSPRMQDVIDYHSTSHQAGSTAARNGVGTLVMTHMVPPPADETAERDWIADAAAHFSGRIVVARDMTTVEAGPRR
jgi:ribonuclease Z